MLFNFEINEIYGFMILFSLGEYFGLVQGGLASGIVSQVICIDEMIIGFIDYVVCGIGHKP